MDNNFLEYLIQQNADNWANALGVKSGPEVLLTPRLRNDNSDWFDYILGRTGENYTPGFGSSDNASMGTLFDRVPGPAIIKARMEKIGTKETSGAGAMNISAQTGSASAMNVTAHATEGPAKWLPLVHQYGQQYGVPDDVILGIMDIESGGNPEAQGAQTKWGKAQGLMQIMPFHWEPGTPENVMRNPAENIKKGIEILAKNYQIYGNWQSAAAAYFGAVDANGNPTTETDANGVNGIQYVQKFENARGKYRPGW